MTERMSCVGKEHKYLKNSSLRQIQIVIVAVVALVVVVNVSPHFTHTTKLPLSRLCDRCWAASNA